MLKQWIRNRNKIGNVYVIDYEMIWKSQLETYNNSVNKKNHRKKTFITDSITVAHLYVQILKITGGYWYKLLKLIDINQG